MRLGGSGRFALIGSGLVKQPSELPPAEKQQAIVTPQKDLARFKERFNEAINRSRNWR